MESLRNRVLSCFVERAPNSLTSANLLRVLSNADSTELERVLQALVSENSLVSRTGQITTDYQLRSYENLPVREYVSVGNLKVPRLIAQDFARPEELNIFFEVLAQRLIEVEAEAQRKFDEKLQSYWGNIVTLFGAFIGVFSLIVGFLNTVPLEAKADFWNVLALSSAQVLPLALILGLFLWALRRSFR